MPVFSSTLCCKHMGAGEPGLASFTPEKRAREMSFSPGPFVFSGLHYSLYFSHFSKWQQVLKGQVGKEKGNTKICL